MSDFDPKPNGDLLSEAGAEIKGMAKEGLHHPSTKPVLIGAGVGAVAGLVLPVLSVPVGLLGGAAFMLYKRLRP
ncbi:hypothetical protein [Novosphingobium sp. Gsoil 351]|uniref:hypothetical protein n=1 Tax=Novosphingobium sp. Gsoil 351 TaxID=2675225 RepID=UPI0012B4DB9D|nr:hypothetical protein [Novosphingobium sp. Gsoil 351]QGN53890.1 hypothetical protein GKE62_04425 [Novosphingobium sp. Gsoil 351]